MLSIHRIYITCVDQPPVASMDARCRLGPDSQRPTAGSTACSRPSAIWRRTALHVATNALSLPEATPSAALLWGPAPLHRQTGASSRHARAASHQRDLQEPLADEQPAL